MRRTRGYFGTMDRFRVWARGKVLFARDGAPGAYLDQFARELQALRLELRMDTCDVRIGSRASGGPNKARNEDPTWKSSVGVEGSGRGSTTYQAAAAAFVYDDHHGDVRVRRVIVVGLALVASLGFGQAEKRAHEPTHVAAGLRDVDEVPGKEPGASARGASFAWTRTSESRLSRRLSALVWYWRERERLFRASNRARSRVRRLMEQTPEVLFLELRRAGIFGASQNLHDLRASGFSKPQIDPLL